MAGRPPRLALWTLLASLEAAGGLLAGRGVGGSEAGLTAGAAGQWRRVKSLGDARRFHGSSGSFYNLSDDVVFEHRFNEDFRRYPTQAELAARVHKVPSHLWWEFIPASGKSLRQMNHTNLCSSMRRLGLKRLVYAGDSMTRQMFRSLVMLLGSENLYGRTISTFNGKDSYSVSINLRCTVGDPIQLLFLLTWFLCEDDAPACQNDIGYKWMNKYAEGDAPTLLVLNTGQHHNDHSQFESSLTKWVKNYHRIFWHSLSRRRREGDRIMYRTSNPGHENCPDITKPLKKPVEQTSWNWGDLRNYNRIAGKVLHSLPKPFSMLDTYSMTVLRADGHLAVHDKPKGNLTGVTNTTDCLHYQLPGAPDWWNHLLVSDLANLEPGNVSSILYADPDLETPWGSRCHGRLRAALEARGHRNLRLACTGGSSTAGAGVGHENTWFARVAQRLSDGYGNISVHNAAQGNTNTFWSWAMMDAVIGDAPDILFWEYAINDADVEVFKATKQDMQQEIELWIRRASQLPSKPALVFLYLYDNKDPNFYSRALAAQRPVIERLSDELGLDTLVVPVGPIMRALGSSALYDAHHPAGGAHYAFADMVFSSISSAAASAPGCGEIRDKAAPALRLPTALAEWRMASATLVEPRFGANASNISLRASYRNDEWPEKRVREGKASKVRPDRKIGILVPQCLKKSRQGLHVELRGELCAAARYVALEVAMQDHGFLPLKRMTIGRPNVTGRWELLDLPRSRSELSPLPTSLGTFLNYVTKVSLHADENGTCSIAPICTPPTHPNNYIVFGAVALY